MINKHIILLTLTILVLFSQIVSADLIPEGDFSGTKFIYWCYKISNINDYPEYVFVYPDIAYDNKAGYGIINNQDNCFNFYSNFLTNIYAFKKTEFNEIKTKLNRSFFVPDFFSDFSRNNPGLVIKSSDLKLDVHQSVKLNDPLEKGVITLNIASLTENNLDIQKFKVIYTYKDGTIEEKVFQTQDIVPEPSRTAILPWWIAQLPSLVFYFVVIILLWFAMFWYILLPIIAIVLIIIILLLRRKRLKK
ncbi:MAG: hypothetical protein Q8N99_06245 [Nanoarchaeota archaeon]|nr:hypothetical protein [Nanoarchaeota archaeon]